MEHEKEHKVIIKDGTLCYLHKEDFVFELDLKTVMLIGEYTNDQGPFFDDWFLLFLDHENQSFQVSMYAENIENVLSELIKTFDFERNLGLVNSSDWKSIVLWPETMKGKEFLQLISVEPSNTVGKIMSFFGMKQTGVDLTNEIKDFIKA